MSGDDRMAFSLRVGGGRAAAVGKGVGVGALNVLVPDDVPREVRQAQRRLQALLQALEQPETVLWLCRGVDLPHLVVGAPAQRVNLHGRPWRGGAL